MCLIQQIMNYRLSEGYKDEEFIHNYITALKTILNECYMGESKVKCQIKMQI